MEQNQACSIINAGRQGCHLLHREERKSDGPQGTRKTTPTHIPFPTRFSRWRHIRKLSTEQSCSIHLHRCGLNEQPRQIMHPSPSHEPLTGLSDPGSLNLGARTAIGLDQTNSERQWVTIIQICGVIAKGVTATTSISA